MATYYVYLSDSLEYLGAVEAEDEAAAAQLAAAVWPVALRVLTWRLWSSTDASA